METAPTEAAGPDAEAAGPDAETDALDAETGGPDAETDALDAETGGPDAETETGAPEAETDASEVDTADEESPPEGDDSPTTGAETSQEAAFASLIEDGTLLGELNGLMVAPASNQRFVWKEAANHCRLSRRGGMSGWRLTTMSQLKRIRAAGMLRAGVYWTMTLAGADSSENLVLDTHQSNPLSKPKETFEARALCVRVQSSD